MRIVGRGIAAALIAGLAVSAAAQDAGGLSTSEDRDNLETAPAPTGANDGGADESVRALAIPESREKLGELVVKQVVADSAPRRHPLFELAMWAAGGVIGLATVAAGVYLGRRWWKARARDSRREQRIQRKTSRWTAKTQKRDDRRPGSGR